MIIDHKNIFIIDAVGALLSALLLGLVLPALNSWVGMPLPTLYFLAGLPIFFGLYDVACVYFVHHQQAIWIRIILFLNSAYCVLTLGLMYIHYEQLHVLGLVYFIIEQIVLIVMIKIQWRLNKQLN